MVSRAFRNSGGLVIREGVHRKLAAILYADVAGYSRLTGADEEGTHRSLSASLDFIAATIEGCGGRVIHYAGDAVLAEFASVVVAVECAVEIQHGLAERNRDVEVERRLLYRIGINLGDVIVDRDDIYGDGVNVAARLESLAEPGGICVSAKVRDEVGNKLDLAFEDMGEQKVKNIVEPVRAYRVRMDSDSAGGKALGKVPGSRPWRWAVPVAILLVLAVAAVLVWLRPWAPPGEIASQENMAFPLPAKPSIAVLPFDNLSGDPDQDYFADGITEDIIATLSRLQDLFVIARNSTFVYKGKPVKVQRVAEELGVRYVLEGSVQRAGDKVRITAQLVDALSGNHLWAERYDRKLDDLFALQDEITSRIVVALRIKLTVGEQARVHYKHTRSLEAWNLLMRGMEHVHRGNKTDNANAREFFKKSVEVDRGYALAYALLAWTHWHDAFHRWSENRELSFERASFLAEKARTLDDALPDVYALQASLHLLQRQFEAAVAAGEKAVAQNPNHATNTAILAMTLHYAGRPEEAIRKYKTAMRLSPYYPAWFLEDLGFTYLDAKQPEEALVAFEKFLERKPNESHAAHAYIGRALAYHALGQDDKARAEVAKAVEADAGISLTELRQRLLNKDRAALERELAILPGLGLPE
jgi:TolB-like protein/class 3 adenylate cyclase